MKNVFKIGLLFVVAAGTTGFGQTSPRFPSPLGINRILTGEVIDCRSGGASGKQTDATGSDTKKSKRKGRDARCGDSKGYMFVSGATVYSLHGHERELSAQVGKSVTLTGKVVGNDIDVDSVKPAEAPSQ